MTTEGFAAARDRVLARRAAHDEHVRSRIRAQHGLVENSPLARLPFPLNNATGPILSLCSTLLGREGTNPAFRVGQVDAELLDEELLEMLKGRVVEGLKYYEPHFGEEWRQEILLVLRAILFKLSIWDHNASYGASLQNLKYVDARKSNPSAPARWQKGLYGIITVLGKYTWEKWEKWLVDQEGGYTAPSQAVQRLSRVSSWASTTHSITAFASFLVFLVNGRYRTLTDRILRLRLTSPGGQVSREVSFEYLNRQLVWHAFTEFLLFLLPLVGISRWRRWLGRAWRKTKIALHSGRDEENAVRSGPLSFLPERTCAICFQDRSSTLTPEAEVLGANIAGAGGVIGSAASDIVNPYETLTCSCIYCFVCIATKLEAEEGGGWTCLRCGELVKKCRPWQGDVLGQKKHGQVTKIVGFFGRGEEEQVGIHRPTEIESSTFQGEFSQWSIPGKDELSSEGRPSNESHLP